MFFLGSLCSDLMWCIYPFLEVNGHDLDLYEFTFKHYFQELKNVLETFGTTLEENGLPNNIADFRSLIRRGYVLEFMIVTSLRPVLNIKEPEKVMKWYKKLTKYEKRMEKGGIHKLLARKPPKIPEQDEVFVNSRYMDFLQFYFKIATSLGAFQEMGLVYFELMKNEMFKDGLTMNSIVKSKPKSSNWFKETFFKCIHPKTTDKEEKEVAPVDKKIVDNEQGNAPFKPKEEMIYVDEDVTQSENKSDNKVHDTIYEDVQKPESETIVQVNEEKPEVETVTQVIEEKPKERSPSPPDPLRALASKLHSDILQYKESYIDFKKNMDDIDPLSTENPGDETEQEDLVNGLDDLDINSIGKTDFLNPNSLEAKMYKNEKPANAVHPNISELALSGMVPNNSYASTFGEKNNISTPLAVRKVSMENDLTSQTVEEAARKLSTERQNDDSDSIKTNSRDRKISVQSVDTRKDSFCSNLSKQELSDLLDQDEADWEEDVKDKDHICKPIQEEQAVVDEVMKDDNRDDNVKGLANEVNVEISKEKDSNIDAFQTETVSDNKNSILAWLNIAKTSETVTSADSDDSTSQDCVHGVLTLDWIGAEDTDIATTNENKADNENFEIEDKVITPDIEPEVESENSIKAWLSLNPENVEMGIKSDLLDDSEMVKKCDTLTEKVEDSKLSTTDIVTADETLTITDLDGDTTETTEDKKSVIYEVNKPEDILDEKKIQPIISEETKNDPIQESSEVSDIESSIENCNSNKSYDISNSQEDITSVHAIISEDRNDQKQETIAVKEVENPKEDRIANKNDDIFNNQGDITKLHPIRSEDKNDQKEEPIAVKKIANPKEDCNTNTNYDIFNSQEDITSAHAIISEDIRPCNKDITPKVIIVEDDMDPEIQQLAKSESLNLQEKRLSANCVEALDVLANDLSKEILTSTLKRKNRLNSEKSAKENTFNENSKTIDLGVALGNLSTIGNAKDTESNLEANQIDNQKTEIKSTDQGFENYLDGNASEESNQIPDIVNLEESIETNINPQESEHSSVAHSKEDLVAAEESQNSTTDDVLQFNDTQDWIQDNTIDFHLKDSKELSANASKEDIEDKMASSKSIGILRKITVDVKSANAKSSEALTHDEDLPSLIDSTPSSVIEDLDTAPFVIKSAKPKRLRNGKDLEERKTMAKSMEIFEYIAENIDQPVKNLIESSHLNGKDKSRAKEDMSSMRHAASNQEISYLSMDQFVGGQEKVLVDFPVSGSASTSSLDKEQVKAKIVEYFTKLVKEEKMSRDLGKNMDENSTNDSSLEQSVNESRNSPINEEVLKDLDKSVEKENSEEKTDTSGECSEEKINDKEEDDKEERETSPKSGASTMRRRRKNSKKNKKKRKSRSFV